MALVAIVQNDIKRVVAYSTLSQLGYMTVALGASAYSAAHLPPVTHAFFKALLFLGAGSVIIALHHEQDMRKMGGLRKYMPITYWTVLIGALASAGIPAVRGLLLQGHDHRGGARCRTTPGAGFAYCLRARRRVRHGALHVPAGVHDVPRQGALRRSVTGTATHGHGRAMAHAPHESPCGRDAAADPARDPVGLRGLGHRTGAVRGLLRRLDRHRACTRRAGADGGGIPRRRRR